MRLRVLLSLVASSFVGSAFAQHDGAYLLNACSARVKLIRAERLSDKDMFSAVACANYFSGFLDSIQTITKMEQYKPAIFLPASGVDSAQLLHNVVAYLKATPDAFKHTNRVVAYTVLRAKFHCPSE